MSDFVPNIGDAFDRYHKHDNGEIIVKHYIIDDQGNEVEVSVDKVDAGVVQDKEYSDTPEGN